MIMVMDVEQTILLPLHVGNVGLIPNLHAYFVRSDAIYSWGGVSSYSGVNAVYWSDRTYLDMNFQQSYLFNFVALGVYPSYHTNNLDRFYGFPLRCLVR